LRRSRGFVLEICGQWSFGKAVPCVHAVATTPVQQTGSDGAQTCPSISTFPVRVNGSACTSSFSRIAQRSLALRPARSHGHLRDRYPGASDISSPPCLRRLLPGWSIAWWASHPLVNVPPFTAHTLPGRSTLNFAYPEPDLRLFRSGYSSVTVM
jgi:hypothetical protein